MNSKKRVFGLMILAVVLSVVMVSAGFWGDLFTLGKEDKNLEGELLESATARVEITPPTTPPDIIQVGALGTSVNLDSCQNTLISFGFVATQGGRTEDLPGTVGQEGVEDVTSYIRGNFSNVAEGVRNIDPGSCIYFGLFEDFPIPGDNVKLYMCSVTANYYDTPASDWTISVQMSSLSSPNNFGPVNNSIKFRYASTRHFRFTAASSHSINWTGISLTEKYKEGDNTLIIENCGNVKIEDGTNHYLHINATKLTGTPQGDTIGASNFTGNDRGITQYCNTADFAEGNWYNIEFLLNKGTGTQNLGFCLKQVPSSIRVPQNFISLNDWVIENVVVT